MKIRLSRYLVPAVLAATIPAAAVFAQGQNQGQNQPPARSAGPSAETLTRLQDGRIAMIKGALKLNDQQLKLWAPVEEQMRSSFTARQQARSDQQSTPDVPAPMTCVNTAGDVPALPVTATRSCGRQRAGPDPEAVEPAEPIKCVATREVGRRLDLDGLGCRLRRAGLGLRC